MRKKSVDEPLRLAEAPESCSHDRSTNGAVLKSSTEWLDGNRTGREASGIPDVGQESNDFTLMDTAYEEYCQLTECGISVAIKEFCDKHPECRSKLRRQIEIHHLIVEHPSLIQECVDTAWPMPGDDVLEFSLLEELGRGSFSRVFRARDNSLGGRQIVLKVCCSGSNEAQILGKLTHDNIVPIHSVQFASDAGLSLICMPYLGRATLYNVLAHVWRSAVPPRRASEILSAAANGNYTTWRMRC